MSSSSENLDRVLSRIDAVNATDPRMDANIVEGPVPKELLYGQRMSRWLTRLAPEASEALQIACRGQHMARWRWPRSDFPEGRAGYKAWRRELYRHHGKAVAELMKEVGYDDEMQARVALLIGKENRMTDAESQTLEDVACLVFLAHEFAVFATKHERPKLIHIVRKTWKKMSEKGRAAALNLKLSEELGSIVEEAIA